VDTESTGESCYLASPGRGRWRGMGSPARNGEKTARICCEELLSGRRRWNVTERREMP